MQGGLSLPSGTTLCFPDPRSQTHILFGPKFLDRVAMHTDFFPQRETSSTTLLVVKSKTNLQSMFKEFRCAFIILIGGATSRGTTIAQSHASSSSLPDAPQVQIERDLGIFPIVRVPRTNDSYASLSAKQKFRAFACTTFDPFAVVVAALGAGITQAGDSQSQYGEGVTHSGNVSERLQQAMDRPHSLLKRSRPLSCIVILAISKRGGTQCHLKNLVRRYLH
jgi:hypothetical protein